MKKIMCLGVLLATFLGCNKDTDALENQVKEQKIILKTNVIDAEYSKKSDQLVYISSNPSTINIFNSNSEAIESVPLAYIPTCISISQDGETAVVGHDGHITYVNLRSKSIINTYSVSCSALDIVLGNNKWAYVFPKEGQWTYIKSVNMNLSYDNEAPRSIYNQLFSGEKGRLHPSGKYIYAENTLSPSTIERFDIQKGDIDNNYESLNGNDYALVPSLWFSEDGIRIFSRKKTVLKTSEIGSRDMVFNGKIDPNNDTNITWLDHSSIKDKLYIILSTSELWNPIKSNFIYTYNASNLSYINKFELEKYFVSDNKGSGIFYNAEPFFVFSNSRGNSLFVITKAIESGLTNEWAIQKIAVE